MEEAYGRILSVDGSSSSDGVDSRKAFNCLVDSDSKVRAT